MNPKSEQMRLRYLYRRKILSGEIRVSRDAAKMLIGPDCAYHLYGMHTPTGKWKNKRVKDKDKKS
jgi:hypothetical protein